jgi:signal transduction histidine kinase/CheY-like chemotaxis protein
MHRSVATKLVTMGPSNAGFEGNDMSVDSSIFVEFPQLKLSSPNDASLPEDEELLKLWVWQNHKQEIMNSMRFKRQKQLIERDIGRRRWEIIGRVSHVQQNVHHRIGLKAAYSFLLDGILKLMQSNFAFIGEAKYGENGSVYLQTHATMISGREEDQTVTFYREKGADLKFNIMNALFQKIYTTQKPLISNFPRQDQMIGTVEGYPTLQNFLCLPLLGAGGGVIGMICISNKQGGYTLSDTEFMEPFTATGSKLIQTYSELEENNCRLGTLEEKVMERTRKLELANKRLEEANRSVIRTSTAQLQHFACMSHEIRTPLNCIIGMTSVLHESELTTMQKESLEMIMSSSNLLLTVVNDVLDYSKLATGNVVIDFQRSSLQKTLDTIVSSIGTKTRSIGMSLRTIFDVAVPEFFDTDSRRLQQILFNLLGNATKFSKVGGEIELHVSVVTGKEENGVMASYPLEGPSNSPRHVAQTEKDGQAPRRNNRSLHFVVKDYGKGIERSEFSNIFKPFRQGSPNVERLYGGTGLGLAITARLVIALGGKIAVDSKLGEWSEFTVDLPFREDYTAPAKFRRAIKDATVFMADNDKKTMEQMTHVFDQCGIPFASFSSMKAIKQFILNNPHHSYGRCICLIQEDLYEKDSFQAVSEKVPATLMTFGPKYGVEASVFHCRSLAGLLPCVLLNSIEKSIVSRAFKMPHTSLTSPSVGSRDGVCQDWPVQGDIRRLRVLVAEDNLVNQKVISRMLHRLGVRDVDIVDDGQKAVDQASNKDYDVILMDMQMPVMDGVEACRVILGNKHQPQQPSPQQKQKRHIPTVVFVTAHVSPSFQVQCEEAGASGFLPKPVKLECIEKCLLALTE